jgi:mannosyl-oligosaccharide alpha-1,2-mannosidase
MRIHAGLVLTSLAGAVRAGNIQLPGLTLPSSAASNAALVKSTFLTAYTDYKTYVQYYSPHLTDSTQSFAWGHDDLEPISKSWTNGRRVF